MINQLMAFLDASPVNFLAADSAIQILEANGFSRLDPRQSWRLKDGDRRYIVQNSSAVMAFVVGTCMTDSPIACRPFHIISAHSDSPCFRIKPHAEMVVGGALKLNTEVYGGPILSTWFDRPLSLAGRVIVRGHDPLHPQTRLLHIRRPLMTIPNLAIHFNRSVNDGVALSKQKDMLPVLALVSEGFEKDNLLLNLIADELDIAAAEILDFDLSLYVATPAERLGLNDEFIQSGRLDDLSMVHAGLMALVNTADKASEATRVLAIFDNEETGSGTKQGAASPLLADLMRRIIFCLGGNEEDYLRAVADSFMISADNAHGVHPNYAEKQDPTNWPKLGGGPVIKINANCKYMTDADSAAVFAQICERAHVPVQYFVNHSDVAGGSTLGNILTSQIPLRGVDMGAPLWAMHSARETAACADHKYTIAAFSEFFTL